MPVVLVAHLLLREGGSLRTLGFDRTRPWPDLGRGAAIAAVIGSTGIAFYLAARGLGFNLTVVPEALPDVWWKFPVLILSAAQNSVLEEVIVVGYLLRRLDQLGWSPGAAMAASSVLRGSYHLYQGVGGFIGNMVMGVVFVYLYRRWGRVGPWWSRTPSSTSGPSWATRCWPQGGLAADGLSGSGRGNTRSPPGGTPRPEGFAPSGRATPAARPRSP